MRYIHPFYFMCLSLAVLITGLIFSPFLLSLGIWGIAIAAFWHRGSVIKGNEPSAYNWKQGRHWWATLKSTFHYFFKNPAYWLLSLLLILPFISGLWSENTGFWLNIVRIHIPFFVLPWAFANLPDFSRAQWHTVIWLTIALLVVTCVGIGINYGLHFDEIMAGMKRGWPIPVPRGHIRFNLILVSTLLLGICLYSASTGFKFLKLAALLFLFAFVHVLAVRSGIMALYVGIAILLLHAAFVKKMWLPVAALAMAMCAILWFSVQYLPSFAQKIGYTVWDWEQYRQGRGADNSDSERLISIQAGWCVFKENPAFGVGIGDIPQETKRCALAAFPQYVDFNKLPHNQFIFTLTGMGVVGLAGYCVALFAGFFQRQYRYFLPFWIFQGVILTSFMVEYTLETSIGAVFYLFFYLLVLKLAEQEAELCAK